MNAPVSTCPRCSAVLRRRGTRSYCPRCLVRTALSATPPSSSPASGRNEPDLEEIAALFPGYEIVRLLGAGGMGLVYEARQIKLDRLVALKLLPADDGSLNPAFAERFTREARSLARLNHPDFVQIHDQGQVPGWFFIVMELVDGPDLACVLKRDGPLAPARAIRLFSRLCESLAEAHRLGIVHRDLKPANLLFDRKGHLKVADFGLAKLVDHPDDTFTLTNEEAALGTPFYMAPEQRSGSPRVDQRADIYALGVVFYEMLTGALPAGNFKPPSQLVAVGHAVDRVVLKALASDPADRFQSLSDMSRALDRAARPVRRIVAAVLVIAVLLLAGATVFLLNRPGTNPPQEGITASADSSDPTGPPEMDWSRVVTLASPHPEEQGYFGQYGDVAGDLYAVSAPGAGEFGPEVEQSGRVHLYRMRPQGAFNHLASLQAPAPHPRDRFGYPLDLSEDGKTLAVSAQAEDDSGSVIYLYDSGDEEVRAWKLRQTLTFGESFGGQDSQVRMVMSGEWMAVSSPEAPPAEAVRLYRRVNGWWKPHAVLTVDEDLNADSHFGFLCKFYDDELYVNAYRAGRGLQHRSGALFVFAKGEADTWRQVQKLTHSERPMFSYFGLDWTFPSPNCLAVGSFGDSGGGALGSGAVVLFTRDDPGGRWKHLHKFRSPDPYAGRAGFGQQLVGDGDGLLMVLSSEGSRQDGGLRSLAHLFEITPERDPPLRLVRRLRPDAEEKWLGRPLMSENHLVIAAPNVSVDGREAVGRVYVVPKEAVVK